MPPGRSIYKTLLQSARGRTVECRRVRVRTSTVKRTTPGITFTAFGFAVIRPTVATRFEGRDIRASRSDVGR